MRQPQSQRPEPETFVIGSSGESEAEMMTARDEPQSKSNLLKTISYKTNISRWNERELEFQLYIRGWDVNTPELSLENLRKKGKGKGLTTWQHYHNMAQKMISDGTWGRRIEQELLKKRIKEFNERNRPRGSRD